jgi:cytoskeletal protein CcmA (bactofilin family)
VSTPVARSEITTLIGRGTRFLGHLVFEGVVRIDGELTGDVQSDDTLIIGEGAEVRAEIVVGALIVRGGTLVGNVRARESIEMYAPAKVVGNVWSPTVQIERGVSFQGQCRMDAVDDFTLPRAQEAVVASPDAAGPSPAPNEVAR